MYGLVVLCGGMIGIRKYVYLAACAACVVPGHAEPRSLSNKEWAACAAMMSVYTCVMVYAVKTSQDATDKSIKTSMDVAEKKANAIIRAAEIKAAGKKSA